MRGFGRWATWLACGGLVLTIAPGARAETGDYLDDWLSKGLTASTLKGPSAGAGAPATGAKPSAKQPVKPAAVTAAPQPPAAQPTDKSSTIAPAPLAKPRVPVQAARRPAIDASTASRTPSAWFAALPAPLVFDQRGEPIVRPPEPRAVRLIVGAVNLGGVQQATRAKVVDGAVVIEGAPAEQSTITVRVPTDAAPTNP